MAKKARRKKRSVLTQSQLVGTRQQDVVTTEKVVIQSKKVEPTAKIHVDLGKEYHYVIADLRRIGILAALMFAVLFGLNLLLR
jgi:hypothetical protein